MSKRLKSILKYIGVMMAVCSGILLFFLLIMQRDMAFVRFPLLSYGLLGSALLGGAMVTRFEE